MGVRRDGKVGSCELLRLVELINCPSYHKWINQHTDHDQQTPTKSDPKTISRKRFEKIMVNSLCVLDPIYERAPLNHLPARLHEQQEEEVKFTLPPLTTEAAKRVHEQRRFSER
ncbi:hypothetical protein NDU88_003366 [Pleurodeles waltl]|uniref:Uncharacterized protein n=1 Tax=Pleurodeles waltl TaxID=8319 RepID=A0AAV7UDU4_PLEWA|nr:hypothetical protein NDU88_003366 [Pleurodeles waltl]